MEAARGFAGRPGTFRDGASVDNETPEVSHGGLPDPPDPLHCLLEHCRDRPANVIGCDLVGGRQCPRRMEAADDRQRIHR